MDGARGFTPYAGTMKEASFQSIRTHADGAIGIQVSRELPKLSVAGDVMTFGGEGDSLVKGRVLKLRASALSVKAGGAVGQLRVGGSLRTTGDNVVTVEVEGCIDDIAVDGGIHAAFGFLNVRERYRFTGVYRLEPPVMRSVCLFDRENPELTTGEDIQLSATYCSLILAARAPFLLGDAQCDERVREHPARDAVLAYCGVPLLGADGTFRGTLCHFDLRPRVPAERELPLLQHAAARICSLVMDDAAGR